VVSIPPTGAAQAQFFDPFSQFYAPQAPAYAPQAPVYAPPVVYRRTPRVSRRSRPVLTSVPDRPHVRRSRVPERVRHVSVPRPTPVRIHLASLPDPAPVPKHKSSEPPAAKESVREEGKTTTPARIRLASLPKLTPVPKRKSSEPPAAKESVREEGKTKLVSRKPTGDPVAALMKDPTLRQGDIVVLPDGPRVFKGGRTTPHRLSDFEDIRRTKLVGDKTRRQLTAMPVQAPTPRVQAETAERRPAKPDGNEGKQVAEQVTTTGSLPRKVGP
jgi:hypothetical protein